LSGLNGHSAEHPDLPKEGGPDDQQDRLDLKRANIEGHSEAAELGQPAGTIERRWAA